MGVGLIWTDDFLAKITDSTASCVYNWSWSTISNLPKISMLSEVEAVALSGNSKQMLEAPCFLNRQSPYSAQCQGPADCPGMPDIQRLGLQQTFASDTKSILLYNLESWKSPDSPAAQIPRSRTPHQLGFQYSRNCWRRWWKDLESLSRVNQELCCPCSCFTKPYTYVLLPNRCINDDNGDR